MKSTSSKASAPSVYLKTRMAYPWPHRATKNSSCRASLSHSMSSIGAISIIPFSMSKARKLRSTPLKKNVIFCSLNFTYVVNMEVSEISKSKMAPTCSLSPWNCSSISGIMILPSWFPHAKTTLLEVGFTKTGYPMPRSMVIVPSSPPVRL